MADVTIEIEERVGALTKIMTVKIDAINSDIDITKKTVELAEKILILSNKKG